jgi:hypothetical protein
MSTRGSRLTFVALLAACTFLGSAAVASILPFRGADGATEPPRSSGSMVDELAPGGQVRIRPDGRPVFLGPLTDEAAAEAARIDRLAQAGPESVSCDASAGVRTCVAVPDQRVVPSLKAGARLYGRTVYGSISKGIAAGAPLLESEDLVCDDVTFSGSFRCTPVGEQALAIPAGQEMLVVYRRYRATFRADGAMVSERPSPSVRVIRAG